MYLSCDLQSAVGAGRVVPLGEGNNVGQLGLRLCVLGLVHLVRVGTTRDVRF